LATVDDGGTNYEDDWVRRVIVKFRDDVVPPEPPADVQDYVAALEDSSSLWTDLRLSFGVSAIERYTSLPAEEIAAATEAARANDASFEPPNFSNYFAVTVPSGISPEEVVARALGAEGVELAEIEPHFTDGSFPDGTNPRLANEGFLKPAPVGIDAPCAWAMPGGTGRGVQFIDVEQGWLFGHEDLAGANVGLVRGQNWTSSRPHGTSAMGIVVMQDNDLGGVGIAPACAARASGCRTSTGAYDLLGAILAASNALDRGDVMLVEQQALDGDNPGPVEVSDPIFAAIRTAVAKGVIVIEAGGNKGTDLDTWSHPTRGRVFNRADAAFRDSGAILVGACSSASPHRRLAFSPTGSRIDCCAWGENVDTASTDAGGATDVYTATFNGTSSASPIIAGVAIVTQAMVRQRVLLSLSPAEMRARLSDPRNGTRMAAGQPAIGVMPDIAKLVANVVLAYSTDDGVPQPLDNVAALAFLDAGHGGHQRSGQSTPHGVRGPAGTWEKDVNLALARATQARLGSRAALSREGDYNVSLRGRLEAARRSGASVYVGLHANSGQAGQRGAEVWVYGDGQRPAQAQSLKLAQTISEELGRIDGVVAPVRAGDIATLRPPQHRQGVAACIVEADYLSSPDGERRLRDPRALDQIGQAIATGVQRFLGGAGRAPDRPAPRRGAGERALQRR